MKLMILDGNSIVNRAFYGVRPLNAPDGTPTNAVYGFLAILQRMLDEQEPEAVCVSFDLKDIFAFCRSSFRRPSTKFSCS